MIARRKPTRDALRFRPRMEALEDRLAPATINWDGGGDGVNWCDAANWEGDVQPRTTDDAVIGQGFGPVQIDCTPVGVRSITTYSLLTVAANMTLNLLPTTITGQGEEAGLLNLGRINHAVDPASRLNIPLENRGVVMVGTGNGTRLIVTQELTNAGTIALSGGNFSYVTALDMGSTTLNNRGTITAQRRVSINAHLVNEGDGIISSASELTMGLAATENRNLGMIRATGGTLVLNPSIAAGSFVNEGTIEAQGGNIRFGDTGTDPEVTNRGIFIIQAGRVFEISNWRFREQAGCTLTGGTYVVVGTFKYPGACIATNQATIYLVGPSGNIVNESNANALANLTLNGGTFGLRGNRTFQVLDFTNTDDGILDMADTSRFNINGTFSNYNRLRSELRGGYYVVANNARIAFDRANIGINNADIDLSESGKIVDLSDQDALTGLGDNQRTLTLRNGSVLNSTRTTFSNSGTLSLDRSALFTLSGSIANTGTVSANNDSRIGADSFSNAGTVTLANLAELILTGAYQQSAGLTRLTDGSLTGSTIELLGGALEGSGIVLGNVRNAAEVVIAGRGTNGVLVVIGDYTQTATGTLFVDVGGYTWGLDLDFLLVTGQVQLDGILNIALKNPFMPRVYDAFLFFLGIGGITGNFATFVGLDLGEGLRFVPSHDGFGYYLQVVPT